MLYKRLWTRQYRTPRSLCGAYNKHNHRTGLTLARSQNHWWHNWHRPNEVYIRFDLHTVGHQFRDHIHPFIARHANQGTSEEWQAVWKTLWRRLLHSSDLCSTALRGRAFICFIFVTSYSASMNEHCPEYTSQALSEKLHQSTPSNFR